MARVAEDEEAARAATTGPWERTVDEHNGPNDGVDVGIWSDAAERYPVESMVIGNRNALADAAHIVRHDPERGLAGCEAKRRIVELHEPGGGAWCTSACESESPTGCDTLRALAAIWSDHADYDEAWR